MSAPRKVHKEQSVKIRSIQSLTNSMAAIRDIKGEYGIMGVLKKTFRREKAISAK